MLDSMSFKNCFQTLILFSPISINVLMDHLKYFLTMTLNYFSTMTLNFGKMEKTSNLYVKGNNHEYLVKWSTKII